MYIPRPYRQNDPDVIDGFMRSNSFATLVSVTEDGPMAVHIPIELRIDRDGGRWLYGHVARANRIWQSFHAERDLLVIFNGPHAYISPQWFSSVNVPTWNYMAVHVYGKPAIIEDSQQMYDMLKRMVERFEGKSEVAAYRMEDLPDKFLGSQMARIVCFQIKVERIEAAYKLSQSDEKQDQQIMVEELLKMGDDNSVGTAKAMAEIMSAQKDY
jgi:transcriptional regulator